MKNIKYKVQSVGIAVADLAAIAVEGMKRVARGLGQRAMSGLLRLLQDGRRGPE